MTVEDEKSLRIFERNILRKIYGPVREGENWRIRSNAELQQLIHERDLVKFIKSQRIRWLGHVERMEEDRMNKRMMQGRLYCGRRRGRPRMRWLDEVLKDLMKLGVRGWREREWRIEMTGGGLLRRPRPTKGCRAGEEEEEQDSGSTQLLWIQTSPA